MEPQVRVFWLPKEGNAAEEYEDAFSYSVAKRRFAIADGATESSFAERWAQGLVRQFMTEPPLEAAAQSGGLQRWLAPLQRQWREGIDWEHLPWFAEEKARLGAFATFLGMEFASGENFGTQFLFRKPRKQNLRWRAMAIGDSCLFQVRADVLLKTFPLERSDQFNSRPVLLCSDPASNQPVWAKVCLAEGNYEEGDLFLLATDALAKWFLAEHEAGGKPWAALAALGTEADFAAWVVRLRKERKMRNDDTTIILSGWPPRPSMFSFGRRPIKR